MEKKKFDGNINISITISELITLREKWSALDVIRKTISQEETKESYLHASIIGDILDSLDDYVLEPALNTLEESFGDGGEER